MSELTKKTIRHERVLDDIEALAQIGSRDGGGMDRPVFSSQYHSALEWLSSRMREIGMAVRIDAAGNLIGRIGPATGPAILSGSHIDTVPEGGKYDGMLGVVGALEVARCLAEFKDPLPCAFEVIAFADEEGAYISLLGARAMFGDLPQDEVITAIGRTEDSLAEVMQAFGLSPTNILDASRVHEEFLAFVELHIEQGPILENEGLQIGVVDNIVGLQNGQLTFHGQSNHAGTTPLHLRSDAFRVASLTVTNAFEAVERMFGSDIRLTFGNIEILPGASNVVPALVKLTQEIRAPLASEMQEVLTVVLDCARKAAENTGVEVGFEIISQDAPATMSPIISDAVRQACVATKATYRSMPSGAGHDAQLVSKHVPTGMIFVPSHLGISHNPREFTEPDHVKQGVQVLCNTVILLINTLS